MSERVRPGEQFIPQTEASTEAKRRNLNPVPALLRLLEGRKEAQEETVGELARQVTEKLLVGISDKGMVSLFRNKVTGENVTEMYTAYFSSTKMPHLGVMVHRSTNHRFGRELSLSMIEHGAGRNYRSLSIERFKDSQLSLHPIVREIPWTQLFIELSYL